MSSIQPFGTSADGATVDGINSVSLKQIKAFGCTVVSFDISADWSSQAGSLSLNLIEDEADSAKNTPKEKLHWFYVWDLFGEYLSLSILPRTRPEEYR